MSEMGEGVHNQDQKRAFQVGHGVLCTHLELSITGVCSCEILGIWWGVVSWIF